MIIFTIGVQIGISSTPFFSQHPTALAFWTTKKALAMSLENNQQYPTQANSRKMCHSKLFMLALLLFFLTLSIVASSIAMFHNTFPVAVPQVTRAEPLTVLTLIYTQSREHAFVEHNCALISQTQHHYIIFTDDLSQNYCTKCECRLFTKANCECPVEDCGRKNPCEKLFFFINLFDQFDEFVFLDSDLLILMKQFLNRLSIRSKAHDFLATYAHSIMQSMPQPYLSRFNSGLFFVRKLPRLNYDEMKKMLYDSAQKRDQYIISLFVQKRYQNWDTLSWKWHCRQLRVWNQDIPLSECYTIHDREQARKVFRALNRSLLQIPTMN